MGLCEPSISDVEQWPSSRGFSISVKGEGAPRFGALDCSLSCRCRPSSESDPVVSLLLPVLGAVEFFLPEEGAASFDVSEEAPTASVIIGTADATGRFASVMLGMVCVAATGLIKLSSVRPNGSKLWALPLEPLALVSAAMSSSGGSSELAGERRHS